MTKTLTPEQKIAKFLNGPWYTSSRRGGQTYRRIANRIWLVSKTLQGNRLICFQAHTTSSLHPGGLWAWHGFFSTADEAKLALAQLYASPRKDTCCT